MAYKIDEKCINCSACAGICPTSAISEGGDIYKIDPDLCIDCGACPDTCPVDAISPE